MVLEVFAYGGAGDYNNGELGGVQILLKDLDLDTKLMFEFGQRPDHTNQYYTFPYSPKSFQALQVAEDLQLFSDLPGIFREDYELHRGRKPGPIPLDGIDVTHAHYDHIGGAKILRPDIPMFMTPESKLILQLWQYTSGRTINQFIHMINQFSTTINNKGETRFLHADEAMIPRNITCVKNGEIYKIGNIDCTSHYVDHSLPGASGKIYRTSAGPVAFSGDIRLRGRRPQDTWAFVDAIIKAKAKYVFWEDSLSHFDHNGTEEDVTDLLSDLIKDKAFAAVSGPPRDLDRLLSLHNAAKKTKRMLTISPAQAKYLKAFDGKNGYPKLNWKYIGVYLHRKRKGLLDRDDFDPSMAEADYYTWEREFIDIERWNKKEPTHKSKPQRVSIEDIRDHQDSFLTYMPANYMIDMFTEIKPKKNSIFIRSHPAPWTKDMEIQEEIQINILKHFGMYDGEKPDYLTPSKIHKMHQVHVTGHLNRAEATQIMEILRKAINPTIIPYHSMHPKDFINHVAKNCDVKLLEIRKLMRLE